MAKREILFNGEVYSIEESVIEASLAEMKSRLVDDYSGSGMTIVYDGTTINVDSAKLATAASNLAATLNGFAGSGASIVVNGVTYGIDSAKLNSAKENMSGTLGEMAGVVEEEDELQGTWVLNANVTDIDIVFTAGPMEAESYNGVYSIEKSSDKYITVTNTGVKALIFSTPSGGEKYGYFHGRTGSKWKWQYGYANADYYSTSAPTLLIYSKLSEVTNGDALLTWLKANATKQSSKPLITFTINGTSYQAEDGMTWAEWCESEYNTDGYKIADDGNVDPPAASWVSYEGTTVAGTDVIIANAIYKLNGTAGGGSN
jgi:hypothetical protein